MLKVYGRANSINVRKVLWMLGELGLPYEREDWGRGFRPTDDPEFRNINPFGVVPVIDDGDFQPAREQRHRSLSGRQARPGRPLPKDLKQRATVESWMDWASTDFAAACARVPRPGRQEPGLCGQVEAGPRNGPRRCALEDISRPMDPS